MMTNNNTDDENLQVEVSCMVASMKEFVKHNECKCRPIEFFCCWRCVMYQHVIQVEHYMKKVDKGE